MKLRTGILFIFYCFTFSLLGQEVTLPYLESFDLVDDTVDGALPNNWLNETEGTTDGCSHGTASSQNCYNWDVHTGTTVSTSTGPSADHTTGSDNYLHVEASGNNNRSVRIYTPSFNLGGTDGYLSFWLHNYNGYSTENADHFLSINILNAGGGTIGSDLVIIHEQSGLNDWHEVMVDLSTYKSSGNIRVQFEWNSLREEFAVDFAIDDITIENCGADYISLFSADFENGAGDNNWTYSSGATEGNWTRDIPSPYTTNGTQMEIAAFAGSRAIISGSDFNEDLDGGPTTATSPDISLPATASSIIVNFKFYFANANNGSSEDNLIVRYFDASDDSLLGTILNTTGRPVGIDAAYSDVSADISADAGATIYFIASAQDASGGSKTEVAIDNFNIDYCTSGGGAEVCNNGADDDGDGLVDCLDSDCDILAACDNDGDLVTDRLDYDDDNDGIPDALECYSQTNLITNAGFESGDSDFSSELSSETCTSDCGPSSDVGTGDYAVFTDACGCGGQFGGVQEWDGVPIEGSNLMVINFPSSGTDNLWFQTVTVAAYTEYSFNVWVRNINFSNANDPEIQLAYSTNGGSNYTIIGESDALTEAEGWKLIGFNFITDGNTSIIISIQNAISGSNGRDIAIDGLSLIAADCDDDGDGVVNRFDLDSDNDGIYDVFESSSGQAQSGGILTGGQDGDGIPSSVSNGNGFIDYIVSDSDNDGLLDIIELDSDDDGCFDSFEENIEDLDNDGTAGTGSPAVNENGLVTSITYITPTLNSWQDPDEDNPSCDGDTDDDGILDIDDLDDDNDGIPDIVESVATIDFSGAKTFLSGTGSVGDLDVGDKVLYDNAIRDCNDNLFDIVVTITGISPGVIVSTNNNGIDIDDAVPNQNDYATFKLNVVETGSATVGNPAGTPATATNITIDMYDVDSDVGEDYTDVVGFNSTGDPPDSTYFEPITFLEEGGFVSGGPGAGWTFFRSEALSGVNNWTGNGNVNSSTYDPEHSVFMIFESFSEVELTFGVTGGRSTVPSNTPRATRFNASAECDRDGDGIPNRVDLDMDNDGIYDLHEAGHAFTSDIDNDGMIDGSDVGSGTNGLFNSLETSSDNGVINYSYSDSDGDGIIFDFSELDSDDDLCFDTEEADVADTDVDGIAGTGTPSIDAFGLVTSIIYQVPPTDNWQDSTETCLEICGNNMDDDGDGLPDEFDPDCADFFLEAECGFPGANWVRTFNLDASNNDFQTIMTGLNSLDVPPTAGADILRFTITTVALGTYRILGRVRSASGADDSFWFRVDEGTWFKWNDWDTGGTWQWIEFSDNDNANTPVRYTLSAGSHSIDLAYREDGAGIDKLHLTINGGTPAGEGEESINCKRSITTNLFLNYKIRNRNN